MAELQREGEPWEEDGKVFLRARETFLYRGQWATEIHEVSVGKGRKSAETIKTELLAALRLACAARAKATPDHQAVDLELPATLTI